LSLKFQNYAEEKQQFLKQMVGFTLHIKVQKKSPENIKDGVFHIRKSDGKRLASAAF